MSDSIHALDSDILAGKTVLLALTGSVAVMRSLEFARLLIRNGARVIPIMSCDACELVGPKLVHWATGVAPITELTGANEHVELAGNGASRADALIVAPATANTIGKIAGGIDDTVVTTFATTAIGQKLPVIVAPAMHQPMYEHPVVVENLSKLQTIGLTVAPTQGVEGKAKMASPNFLLDLVIRTLSKDSPAFRGIRNRKILVTAGRTVEYIDPVRVISNNSSGKMGVAVARAAYRMGADVTLIYGKGTAPAPEAVTVIHAETAAEMYEAVLAHTGACDALVAAAAVGDWQTRETAEKKVTTHGTAELNLTLVPTPKIIDEARRRNPSLVLVAFRAQHDLPSDELLADARRRMTKAGAEMIAVNDVSHRGAGFEVDTNELTLLLRNGRERAIPLTSKQRAAHILIEELSGLLCEAIPEASDTSGNS